MKQEHVEGNPNKHVHVVVVVEVLVDDL